jgi:ATP-dependent helicase/nuclease subunit B
MTKSAAPPATSAPHRVFLDWQETPLAQAAEWLFESSRQSVQTSPRAAGVSIPPPKSLKREKASSHLKTAANRIDLSQTLVVIPSARARRRLLQRLYLLARAQNAPLLPPKIVTIGSFPEDLYENAQPLADSTTRLLTWLAAFQGLPLAERQLFLPRLTASDLRRELSFAEQLAELHVRLGTEIRSFRSVHEHLERNPEVGDVTRWAVLSKVQSSYYERLSRLGLWDVQAARNVAIRKQLCQCDHKIVLVGAVDLSESNRQMLLQLGSQVTTLIFAPATYSESFDEVGAFRPEAWINHRLTLPDEWLTFADRPADQAEAVLAALRELKGSYAADQITIGVPDDTILPALELALENEGLVARRLEGSSFRESPAVRFAEALSQYLERADFSLFAQIVRHPDLYRWLSSKLGESTWLPAVDKFQETYLASKLSWLEPIAVPDDEDDACTVSKIHAALRTLLTPFIASKGKSLAEVSRAWRHVLSQVYSGQEMESDEHASPESRRLVSIMTAQQLDQCLAAIEQFAVQSQASKSDFAITDTESITPAEALALAISAAPRNGPGDPPNEQAIELVGWLDLPLDDAPVLIATAMNEDSISSQDPVIPLLPPQLQESLGIGHAQHRQARNNYALSLAVKSRKRVKLICGRHDGDGNPLLISRLLLAENDETLVRRVNTFFSFAGEQVRRKWLKPADGWAPAQTLVVPKPEKIPEQTKLSVTRFRDYIKCPYRFYLNAVLHLEPVRDSLREMDGGAFGSVAHNVLEAFGRHKVRNSEEPADIKKFLDRELKREADSFRQQSWFAAVEVQLESLRERLHAFAEIQAQHRAEGWEIIAVEKMAEYTWPGTIKPFCITGRIDRVDRHKDGRLAVWDYKTSDKGTKVNPAHRDGSGNWVDLQLPLYRYLIENVPEVGADAAQAQRDSLQLGYVLLPRTIKDVAFDKAAWDAEELASADKLTSEIVKKIQKQVFWPPSPEPPPFSEQYAAICQDCVYDRSAIDG